MKTQKAANRRRPPPPAPTLESVRAAIKAHEAEIRDFGVVALGVFGSVAKGYADEESDVDLCVLEMDWDKFINSRPGVMSAMLDLKKFFSKILRRKTDVIYEPRAYNPMGRKILAHAKTILEAPPKIAH